MPSKSKVIERLIRILPLLILGVTLSVAQESPHGKIRFSCESCHNTSSWELRSDPTFNHTKTSFPLEGQHTTVSCVSCHKDLQFSNANQRCTSCHTDIHKSELGPNCERCHTIQAWKITDMIQKHQGTRFPLVGKHSTANCETCHSGASQYQYVGTPVECIGCHRTDYQNTANPDHRAAGFSTACSQCHASSAFTWGSGFNHELTAFPLTGAHRATACISCHQNNNFTSVPVKCYSCHFTQAASTVNPNHTNGSFSHECATCHTTTVWKPSTFDHNSATKFPLLGAHRLTTCNDCHTHNQYAGLSNNCIECHRQTFISATNPNHQTPGFSQNCAQCHTTTAWQPATFDHNTTKFALTGAHAAVQCQTCHTNGNYQLTYTDCYQCHSTNFQAASNPNHVTGNFSHQCQTCHTTTAWQPATFDHNTTKFVLTGAHAAVQCQSCHTNGNYQLTYTDCYQCHSTNFQTASNPNHVTGNFSHQCQTCHTTTAWQPATFDHNTTKFVLTGAHSAVQCQSCHTNGNYQLTYTDCYQCHTTNFQGALNPNHVAGNFSHQCQTCHTTTAWQPATFDHNTTKFVLTGAHAAVQCQSCHTNGNYQLTYTDCYQCHTTNFQGALNPNHVAGNFSHQCQTCHSTTAWQPATFDHNSTKFVLTGAHVAVQCQSCHTAGNYQLAYTDCYQCHTTNFQGTSNPNHVTGNFSHQCQTCHTTTVWKPSTFDHTSATKFPLLGAHRLTTCNDCHTNNLYAGLPATCIDCHRTNFTNATNPNHQTQGFSQNCTLCHTTTAWQPATFDHNTTKFVLTGAHKAIQCQTCHTNGNYRLTYTDCYQCHTTNFQGATNPNHVAGNFSHQCQTCHTTTSWQPAAFDHSTTKFVLTGAHVAVQCQTCHTNGNYQLVYTDCYQCHTTNFQGATNPNHVTGNFSHQCQTCHTTTAWQPASFDHATTKFVLTGAHIAVQCQTCHTNGNYQLAYTDCYQCHTANFQGTTNPNHAAGNFSHLCQTCHTTTLWKPSTFDHTVSTKFPLLGAHRLATCNDCHLHNQYADLSTNCIDCHRLNYTNSTNPNHQTLGFSQNCALCHTTTAWQPATFDHNTTKFVLSGAHTAVQCQTCHINGNYQLVYTDCYQCHSTNFQGALIPNHVTGNFSHQCQTCHTATAWQPSTFDHNSTKFVLTGAHTTVQCQLCHTNGNYQLTYTDCYQCHSTNFQAAANPNHVAGNFSHQCQTCHTTTAWQPATFDHNTTKFVLTGAHTPLQCQTCHTNGNYQLVYTDCYQCHSANFQGALIPNHVTGNFSHLCQTCHTTTAWQPSTFDHNTTKFVLTGAHTTVQCQLCHTNGNYQLVYTDCYQCHSTNFQATTNPNHVTGNFSHQCQTCHTTTAWQPATFDHNTTKFTLTGAHIAVQCQTCHTNGNYQLVYTDCYQCHSTNFQGAANPNHVTGNFSHLCQTCHTTTAWQPATFNHSTTKFPLTGAHTALQCQTCHTNGNYQLAYSGCYICHTSNYNGTTNPNHTAAGFPTTCETCHSTATWSGATFNHTWFPVNHGGANNQCSTCHTNPSNYSVFQCTNCHTQSQTNSHHSGVRNYAWNSISCYQCHPRGNTN